MVLTGVFTACSSGPNGEYNLELYAENDVHGRYFDSLYVGGGEYGASMANISGFVNGRREAIGAEQVILIDNGDHLQGDNAAYYFNYVEKPESDTVRHLFSKIMNYMNFDAVVVGNHDIETGHPVYDRIKKELKMPYLSANALKTDGTGPYFEPYTILNKNGVKVAIIGMGNPNIKKWLAPALWEGMEFVPIQQIADSLITAVIEKEKPHVVVLAMHAGLGDGTAEDYENPARYLAANLKNVDIILASHDHMKACEKIWNGQDSVLVLEAASRAELLAGADIQVTLKNGKVVAKKISGKLLEMKDAPKDIRYLETFRRDFEKVKTFTNKKIGSLSRDIHTCEAFFGSSDYMDMIHFAQLNETGADISLAAPLTSNAVIQKGDLNFQDLFTIYPYENQLYLFPLTGKQIKGYLEFSYDKWISTMQEKGDHILNIAFNDKIGKYRFKNMSFNFDSGAGINYTVDVSKPYGERIQITTLSDGRLFSPDTLYKVAISSYRANGGGDLLEKGAGIPTDQMEGMILERYPEIRDAIYKCFSEGKYEKLPEYKNWKFIPESYTRDAIKRDKALMF